VAPGTDILSARSAKAKRTSFWGEHAPNRRYAYMGGTSMAAPLVAGCAALVREYLVSERGHEPSAALLKAVLINGTRWLTGADALADHPFCPNYHQGFGAVFVPGAIPNEGAAGLRLEFVDTWREPATRQLRASGDVRRYAVTVGTDAELRFCLTYTDVPGRALQNDLNLFVQHIPSGRKWIGNGQVRSDLRGPDRDNNIEIVRIENAPAGEYLVQVAASNILRGPQDFALVATGALETGLVARS
jgi:serine protease AprX